MADEKQATEEVADKLGELTGPQYLAAQLITLQKRLTLAESLIAALGDALGVELKQRQVEGGYQMYWEKEGRIILPQ